MDQLAGTYSLPTGGQLLVYLTRQLALGELHRVSVHREVAEVFDEAGFPEGPVVMQGTLAAVLSCANRLPKFGSSAEGPIEADEQCLLECLASLQQRPDQCACRYLSGLFEGYALTIVMPYLIGMARLFAAHDLQFVDPRAMQNPVSGCLH